MLDLNTVIAPGSGFQLTNAFNINDRGEILAKGAPLGFTPNDDADLGHLVLVIPCEADDEEGCDASATDANKAAPLPAAPGNKSAATSSPHGSADAWHSALAGRYHVPGRGTPRN